MLYNISYLFPTTSWIAQMFRDLSWNIKYFVRDISMIGYKYPTDFRKKLCDKYSFKEKQIENYKSRTEDRNVCTNHAVYFVNDKGKKRYFGIINNQVIEL